MSYIEYMHEIYDQLVLLMDNENNARRVSDVEINDSQDPGVSVESLTTGHIPNGINGHVSDTGSNTGSGVANDFDFVNKTRVFSTIILQILHT